MTCTRHTASTHADNVNAEPNTAHRLVTSQIADLALKFPHVDWLAANVGDGDPATALLSMEEIELLQEIETGASGSFERVELLQASFEAEGLVEVGVSAAQREREREREREAAQWPTSVSIEKGGLQPSGGTILQIP